MCYDLLSITQATCTTTCYWQLRHPFSPSTAQILHSVYQYDKHKQNIPNFILLILIAI